MMGVGSTDDSSLAGLAIELGGGTDQKHQMVHVFLWQDDRVLQADAGLGVIENMLQDMVQSGRMGLRRWVAPLHVDLTPGLTWARACKGQPYHMGRNVTDALEWFVSTWFRIGTGGSVGSFLRRILGRPAFRPPRPFDTGSKNCVELVVGGLQNCPTLDAREELSTAMTPAGVIKWLEAHGFRETVL